MNYFVIMSKSIKASFKYELFRFLNIKSKDIGGPDNCANSPKTIQASIIYPDSITGFSGGVRMVSLMMKPEDLLENACVLRKDSWDQKANLYQRLIEPKRIKSIRDFVVKNKTTFLNNVIVTLPSGIRFYNDKNEEIKLSEVTQFDHNIRMSIPLDYNSMAIIDGQHRVFAYYEDYDSENKNEVIIKKLRDKHNLLVTGIIYPDTDKYNNELERRKFESDLFVSINKNAKAVDADTLIQVQSIMNPTSGEAISRRVIQKLNSSDPFKDMFQLSKVGNSPIKTASIIQYALSSLLVAKNNSNCLYKYWLLQSGRKDNFELKETSEIEQYINYCAKNLIIYFSAIKSKFISHWNKNSKLLKVISLNAFIIAYRETLDMLNGPQNYDYYLSILKDLDIDFSGESNTSFKYGGAQYSKFAKEKIIPLFINKSDREE